jgi:peptidoglycan/xylan/chitin deacetylase (PgdA/CDA1 family)
MMTTALHAVMYHYVRDIEGSRFPRIKGLRTEDFRRQVDQLRDRYEMATLDAALDFLQGRYAPKRDLCLLTFDDGLRDHHQHVTPILAERRIEGLFFLITGCIENAVVAPVHQNHLLMATLELEELRSGFLRVVRELAPETELALPPERAQAQYRWDTPEVAAFKYLLNFGLPASLRNRALDVLFREHLGPPEAFARELYLSWDEARAMQSAGMSLGGHTHTHVVALAAMSPDEQRADLELCASLLRRRLSPSRRVPFSYPWGKANTFTPTTTEIVKSLAFDCAFSTIVGSNLPGADLFSIHRIDTKDLPAPA